MSDDNREIRIKRTENNIRLFYAAVIEAIRGCAEIRNILNGLPTRNAGWKSIYSEIGYDKNPLPEAKLRRLESLLRIVPVGLRRAAELLNTTILQHMRVVHPTGVVELRSAVGHSYGEIALEIAQRDFEEPYYLIPYISDLRTGTLEHVCSYFEKDPFQKHHRSATVEELGDAYAELLLSLENECVLAQQQPRAALLKIQSEVPVSQKVKRPGRPCESDLDEEEKIAEAWRSKRYKTYKDLGLEFRKTQREIRLILDRHRQRKKRETDR